MIDFIPFILLFSMAFVILVEFMRDAWEMVINPHDYYDLDGTPHDEEGGYDDN